MDEFRKRAVFVLLLCISAVLLVWFVWAARYIILLVFASCIGALFLSTLTNWTQKLLRVRRGGAFAIVICSVALVLGLGIWARGALLLQQLGDLEASIPAAIRQIHLKLQSDGLGRWLLAQSTDPDQLDRGASFLLSKIGGAMYVTGATIASMLVVVVTSLYMGAEPDFYLRGIRRLVPKAHRPIVDRCLTAITETLRMWIVARALCMVTIGIFISCGLLLIGVPLAGTLGIIAAILTFVPNIGPILSVVPAALLAFSISPFKAIMTIGIFGLAHFLEGNLVSPLMDRKMVRLPPSLTLSMQLLLALFAGALGVALAAPLTAATLAVLGVLLPHEDLSAPGRLSSQVPSPSSTTLTSARHL
jgi:predicted PurR-regulated permease PerM